VLVQSLRHTRTLCGPVEAVLTAFPGHQTYAVAWACASASGWEVRCPAGRRQALHLIAADLARKLPPGRVQKFRLALASEPHDVFFPGTRAGPEFRQRVEQNEPASVPAGEDIVDGRHASLDWSPAHERDRLTDDAGARLRPDAAI
jgi:hypothetical protein